MFIPVISTLAAIAMIVIVFSLHMIRTPLSSTLEHSALVFKEQEVSTKTSDGLQGNSNDDTNFKVAMITMFH